MGDVWVESAFATSDSSSEKSVKTLQLHVTSISRGDSQTSVQLSYVCQDCEKIPSALHKTYGQLAKRLDLSFNDIRTLEGLGQFTVLEELVLDNNSLGDSLQFPSIPTLNTLSMNKNRLSDLEALLLQLGKRLPNLTYLSLLGNPACPDQLSCIDKDEEDYQRYRYQVLYMLPKLKFLDSRLVKNVERVEAIRVGAYVKVVRPKIESDDSVDEDAIDASKYNPLPSTTPPDETSHRGQYGVLKYRYTGKHSEGNRFIKNSEL